MVRSPSRDRVVRLEIAPAGALAGRVLALVLAGSSVVLVVASWEDLWRRCGEVAGPCVERAAAAGLLAIASLIAAACGVGIWLRIRRRPVDADGSSRYVVALGILFAAGLILLAARIPAFTCDRGRFDTPLQLCMHPPSTSEPSSWLWAKKAIVVLGLAGGVVIAARPRMVRLSVVAVIVAWAGGFGWVTVDAIATRGP